jgi:hypothetical protein
MSTARLAFALPLLLLGGEALAQSRERPAASSAQKSTPEQTADVQKRVADWLRTCLEDWDKDTHMTKVEWRTTCQRVANERGKFLTDNPSIIPKRR